MKKTIFQQLTKNYRIKYPLQSLPSHQFFQRIEELARSFYQFYFREILKTNPTHPFLAEGEYYGNQFQIIYTQIFYSLGKQQEKVIDFIVFIVSLLSQIVISTKSSLQDEAIKKLYEELDRKGQKLRQHMYIEFTRKSIGKIVGLKRATIAFDAFIQSQNNRRQSFGEQMRVNAQFSKVKQNIQKKQNCLTLRTRSKKKIKTLKNVYQELVKQILNEGKIELEEEKRKKKKMFKIYAKCLTEQLPKSSRLSQIHDDEGLPVISKFLSQKNPNKKIIQQNQPQFWKNILVDMKNMSFLSREERLEAFDIKNLSKIGKGQKKDNFDKFSQRPNPKSINFPQISKRSIKKMHPSNTLIQRQAINQQKLLKQSISPKIDENLYKIKSRKMKQIFDDFQKHIKLSI